NAGLHITIKDERIESADKPEKERMDSMCYEGGIREFVRWYNRHKTPLHEQVIYMSGTKGDDTAEVALQYNDSFASTIVSFANDIHTPEGGMHEEGFKRALTNVLNAYGVKKGYIKGDDKVSGDDVREGLTAIVSVKLTEAQFEGQTKAKLGNASMRTLVSNIVTQQLAEFLEENPAVGKAILDKAMMANRAREAARKAREAIRRKTGLESGQMPDKLRDCNDTDPTLTEIYIVEGDSAGGSAKEGRDRHFQAILPLRGKILNVEKTRLDKALGNNEIKSMLTAFGCGFGDEFDESKLRYHRIVCMTDADVDGAHIRILMLTFFYRYMRPLVEKGYVYAAMPPLYKVTKGKMEKYVYDDDELQRLLDEIGRDPKPDIQRYKGLGEMSAEQLWQTTMNPETRTMMQITPEDAMAADEIFTLLMGDQVEPRRKFIEENADLVKDLDV
ncbi:MAG TPA: DNA topoisomerase IV subunit B, partial [Clostridiales bacterium]|nr:DNA topoisomerase IV subunit B [Clostridiales bacterium]